MNIIFGVQYISKKINHLSKGVNNNVILYIYLLQNINFCFKPSYNFTENLNF